MVPSGPTPTGRQARCPCLRDCDHIVAVILRAEASSIDELGRMVVSQIQLVDGITRTLTCPVVHL